MEAQRRRHHRLCDYRLGWEECDEDFPLRDLETIQHKQTVKTLAESADAIAELRARLLTIGNTGLSDRCTVISLIDGR